jgi:polyisoprenoid-binding protein YceI
MKHFIGSTILALLATSFAALAQGAAPPIPGKPDPKAVKAGTYVVEPYHTQIGFSVVHFGFSEFNGLFSGASGELKLDPTDLPASSVDVTVPVDSVQTTVGKLTNELKGDKWFDEAKYPTIHFQSTRIVRTGPKTADITGTLTLHGISHPLVLKARFIGAGVNFLDKSFTIGFRATGTIHRTSFGLSAYAPLISDETQLVINAAFHKTP